MDRYEVEHVLTLVNSSTQYDVMHSFRQSVARAFESAQVKASQAALHQMESKDFLLQMYRSPPDCTFAFNGPRRTKSGKLLAEEINLPHVAWLVDAAHFSREFAEFPLHILITPDQKSEDLMRKWGAKHAHFLPHAADPLPAMIPMSERQFPIVFLGSIADPLAYIKDWRSKYPTETVDFLIEAADKTLKDPDLCYQDLLATHPMFQGGENDELIQEFDVYMRMVDRIQLLRSLSGLPVHLFGNVVGTTSRSMGEIIGGDLSGLTIHPSVNFSEALEIMQKAQIVLNSSPMFKTGAHERIFYAPSAGAVLLTNETPWIRSHFQSPEELITYRTEDDVKERVKALLEKPEALKSIANAGREKVLAAHTWNHRIRQLLEIMNRAIPDIS
jgi:spore maturation protein CgeB